MKRGRSIKQWVALVAGGAALAGGSAFVWNHLQARVPTPQPVAATIERHPAPTVLPGARREASAPGAWEPGTKRVYDVDVSTSLDTSAATRAASAFATITLSGRLELTAQEASGARVLRGQLSALGFALGDGKTPVAEATVAPIRRGLGEPFFAELDEQGRVERVFLARGLDLQAESLVKTVLAATQFVVPAQGAPDEWDVEESDTSGTFVAHYRRLSAETFAKTKGEYRKMPAQDLFGIDRVQSTSEGRISRAGHGELDDRESEDRTEMRLDDGSFVSVTRVGLRTIDAQKLSRVSAPDLAGLVPSRLDELVGAARNSEHQPDPGVSVASVLSDLGDPTDGERAFAQQRKLVQLLKHDPSNVRELGRRIRQGDARLRELGLGALADAATPEAQRELLGLARDSGQELDLRSASLANLGLSENFTQETVDDLRSVVSDTTLPRELHATAALALGSAARDPSTGGNAVGQLLAALDAEPANGQPGLYLEALGNAGDPAALPAIERALSTGDIGARVAAVHALRFIDDPRVDPLLVGILTSDPDELLRLAAIGTIGHRALHPVLMQAIETALRTDDESRVRAALVALLSDRRQEIPGVAPLLQNVAGNDPDEGVRQQAAEVLATLKGRA